MLIREVNIDPRIKTRAGEPLISAPLVVKINEFTEASLSKFEKELSDAHCTGQDFIPVVIDSFGGGAYECMGFLSAIDSCKKPVATIVSSKAMSCGAIIAMYGTPGYRFMDEYSTMMIHELSCGIYGKNNDIQSLSNHLDKFNSIIFERLDKKLGKPKGFLFNLMHKKKNSDLYLTAKKCVKLGLMDKIGVPSIKLSVKLEMKLE